MAKKLMNRDSIPDEIIAEILPRLPVKSLCRFKCVAKPWLSLIYSERFVKTHLQSYSNKFPRILVDLNYSSNRMQHCSLNSLLNNSNNSNSEDEEEEEAINLYYPGKHINRNDAKVIGSFNGLLCLSYYRALYSDLYLFNPCTRRCNKLPPDNDEMIDWIRMKHQFVYSAVDDDYKVICFYTNIGELQANIYSWRANSWITPVCIKASVTMCREQMFLAGKIHFGTCDPLKLAVNEDEDIPHPILFDIVSFDLETGVYGTIEQPDYGDGVQRLFLEELGGCFSVVCRKENHADLWVMKEYGNKESWTKMLIVSFLGDPRKAYINPVTILPSGEILIAFYSSLKVYNLKDNSLRVLNTSKFDYFQAAYLYVESLVSPRQLETRRQEDH